MGGTKATGTLLVDLGTGRNTVNSHIKEFLGSNLAKEMLDVGKDVEEDLLFGDAGMHIIGIAMRAGMNQTVHVQVEIVKLWNVRLRNELRTQRKSF